MPAVHAVVGVIAHDTSKTIGPQSRNETPPAFATTPARDSPRWTQAEWDKKHKDYKTPRAVDATATHARHRLCHAMTTGYKYGHIFSRRVARSVSIASASISIL
jgi:hypothetical protein